MSVLSDSVMTFVFDAGEKNCFSFIACSVCQLLPLSACTCITRSQVLTSARAGHERRRNARQFRAATLPGLPHFHSQSGERGESKRTDMAQWSNEGRGIPHSREMGDRQGRCLAQLRNKLPSTRPKSSTTGASRRRNQTTRMILVFESDRKRIWCGRLAPGRVERSTTRAM
jgi:hypothetical protein